MNRKLRLLVTAPVDFIPKLKRRMARQTRCTFAYGAGRAKTLRLVRTAQAWLCSPCPSYIIDERILKDTRDLEVLVTPSTGINHIDLAYCRRRGIKVLSLRDTDEVKDIYASSEFTFALMAAVVRNIPQAANAAMNGLWRTGERSFRGRELRGMVLGIIGYGRIGRNLARYANAFGMKILAYDPNVKVADDYVEQKMRYRDVLRKADIVTVSVDLNRATRGMVDAAWFKMMKKGVYFINTSRGEVIDEKALLKNLVSGKIRACGLDVMSGEFNSSKRDHPAIQYARSHTNLIITPHIAGLTIDSEAKAQNAAYKLILAHAAGGG